MTTSQVISALRSVAAALGGAAVAFGVMTATQSHDLIDAVNQIGTAAGSIIAAIGIIAPIVTGIFGTKAASPQAQIEAVATMTGPEKIEALRALPASTRVVAADGLVGVDVAVNPALASPQVVAVAKDESFEQVKIGKIVPLAPLIPPLTRKAS